jgi:hypothetical protein
LASGALAIVDAELEGSDTEGEVLGACAAARFAAEGDEAGSNPGTSTACGVAPADGSAGAPDCATVDALSS